MLALRNMLSEVRYYKKNLESSVTVDGKWSKWSPWSSCDVTCGNGTMVRHRLCNNPAPQNGGLDCPGKGTEKKTCILQLCPGKYKRYDNQYDISKLCLFSYQKI